VSPPTRRARAGDWTPCSCGRVWNGSIWHSIRVARQIETSSIVTSGGAPALNTLASHSAENLLTVGNANPAVPYSDMVRYDVTPTGPKGYQVTAIGPLLDGALVGDFCSEADAEAFAERMRQIDAAPPHTSAGGEV